MDNQPPVPRGGPTAHDYLADFFQFLRRRLRFTDNTLRAPAALHRVFEQMQAARFPRELWRGLMNTALRVIAFANENPTVRNFVDILTQVLIGLWYWYTDNWLLRIALFMLSFLPVSTITNLVWKLYGFVSESLKLIWDYISERLNRYINFITYEYRTPLPPP